MRTVGFLGATTHPVATQWTAAFVERLQELGWIEGRTITIDYRWADGSNARAAEIAAEFVQHKIDVIVTWATAMVVTATQATTTIPIVFAAAGDPLGTGLVSSLARPGSNVTGPSLQQTENASKRLELLRDAVLALRRLAVLANISNPAAVLEVADVRKAARELQFEVVPIEIRYPDDIEPAFVGLAARGGASEHQTVHEV